MPDTKKPATDLVRFVLPLMALAGAVFGFLVGTANGAPLVGTVVGAIVGELPTGAVAGLGARLLAGSYYGQTVQIWSALLMAAALAGILVMTIDLIGASVNRRMGAKPA